MGFRLYYIKFLYKFLLHIRFGIYIIFYIFIKTIYYKFKICKGSEKIEESFTVLIGEDQKNDEKPFSYPCGACFVSKNRREPCKECDGHKNIYKYEILPVPI